MILRLLVAVIICYLMYRLFRLLFLTGEKTVKPISRQQQEHISVGEDLVEDPYCHTYIPLSNAWVWQDEGRTLYFCSRRCMENYINKSATRGD
jgi:YHS domain-containing protein